MATFPIPVVLILCVISFISESYIFLDNALSPMAVLNPANIPVLYVVVPDDVPEVILKEISWDPSNSLVAIPLPYIVNLCNTFVAVAALPDKSPINFGAVTIPDSSTKNCLVAELLPAPIVLNDP